MRYFIFGFFSFFLINVSSLPTFGASAYDAVVMSDNPVSYLRMSAPYGAKVEQDRSGYGNSGRYYPVTHLPQKTRLPNGEAATVFNGFNQYLEVPSSSLLSIRKALTLEAWIRPDTLQFPTQESDGYVHWAGKGESGSHEYAFRMYSKTNASSRPNRISGYVFNPTGGLGSGSYFEDKVVKGAWMHVVLVIDVRTQPGTVSLFKNGVLRKVTSLSQFSVVPQPGNAPLRIATRDFGSFFQGAIGKFAVYAHPLSSARIEAHFSQMKK